MTEAPEVLLGHYLKKLKLPTFLSEHARLARQCAQENVDHVGYLLRLAELELIERERRMIERRIKVARFSPFGILEMTRQRVRPSLKRTVHQPCLTGIAINPFQHRVF